MHKKKYICPMIFLLLGYTLFSYNFGCGIETIQLLNPNETISSNEGTSVEEGPSQSETVSPKDAGQEPLPEEDLSIELSPPENALCASAQASEAQWWVSSNKSSVFLLGFAGAANASVQTKLFIPPTWIATPSEFWTDEKGEFGVLLRLSSNGQKGLKQQTIFVQIGPRCRSIELSSDKDKYKNGVWEALSVPILQVSGTSTLSFRVSNKTTTDTKVFSSHPFIASVEDVQETRSNTTTTLRVKLKGRAKGSFTLLLFEPSAAPFHVLLNVVE